MIIASCLAFDAPFCRGRMLPAIFTNLGVGKKERFPGDPWPHLNALPAWYWMHSNECREAAKNTIYAHALYRDKHVAPALRETWPDQSAPIATEPAPRRARAAQAELFSGAAV